MRALEDIVGLPLFERGYRRIRFTAEGERLFRLVDPAMQVLQSALAEGHPAHGLDLRSGAH